MSNTKNTVIAALALCTGVLGVIVWRQNRDLRRAMATPDATTAARGAFTMTLHPAAQRHLAVPRPRPMAQNDANLSPVGAPSEITGAPAPAAVPRRATSALVGLMENPEFLQALTLQRQLMLDSRFAELFRRLNLEADQLAAFKRLLAEKENVALDVVAVSETGPQGSLPPEAMRASIRAAHSEIEQAIQSSLGGERYAVYRDYEKTLAHRATVAQLEQRLSYTRTPLTPQQTDAVVRILSSNTSASDEVVAPPVSVLVRAGVPEAIPILPATAATGRVTEEAIVQAQAVLSPAQVDALRDIQLEQQAALKAAQMIRDVAPAATEVVPLWPTLLLR